MRVRDRIEQCPIETIAVEDDLAVVRAVNRARGHGELAAVLDVDDDLRTPLGLHVADGAALLAAFLEEYLIADANGAQSRFHPGHGAPSGPRVQSPRPGIVARGRPRDDRHMADDLRIGVEEARGDVTSGKALLVCAYADEAKCRKIGLDGSITLAELESRRPALPKSQELIFFCA